MRNLVFVALATLSASSAGLCADPEQPFDVSLRSSRRVDLSPYYQALVSEATWRYLGDGTRVISEIITYEAGKPVHVWRRWPPLDADDLFAFLPEPFTLQNTESETSRREASNQALQLTADRREEQFFFYETFSDISKPRLPQR